MGDLWRASKLVCCAQDCEVARVKLVHRVLSGRRQSTECGVCSYGGYAPYCTYRTYVHASLVPSQGDGVPCVFTCLLLGYYPTRLPLESLRRRERLPGEPPPPPPPPPTIPVPFPILSGFRRGGHGPLGFPHQAEALLSRRRDSTARSSNFSLPLHLRRHANVHRHNGQQLQPSSKAVVDVEDDLSHPATVGLAAHPPVRASPG